ncbi:MAG: hypothetical protein LBK92_02780 [Endomicrobium sp.]|jgi:hypothetical protein|nr:hypothetical protein [Endomicrobium sp.]
MEFSMDMSLETEKANDVFPEGLQEVEIISTQVSKSKTGNDMLTATMACLSTGEMCTFYFTMMEGKRWLLKNLLEVTGMYEKDKFGHYKFDTDKLLGKKVMVLIQNVEEEYTDKDLNKQNKKRSKIRRFLDTTNPCKNQKKEEKDVEIPF